MGQVDIAAVQRHLAAEGHRLSTSAVASLLKDLGFPVESDVVETNTYGVKLTASVQYPERERWVRAETLSPRRERTPAAAGAAQGGVSRLLAKLEELERQLAAVSISQDRLEGAWPERSDEGSGEETMAGDLSWTSKPAPSPHMHLLGSEAQQLRDWAQGRWPAVAAPPPPPLPQRDAADRRRSRGSRPPSRRTDPVARYRYAIVV